MKEISLALFEKNYYNKGMCEKLPDFIKNFTKEFKKTNVTKTISYLPWAVVERIFRMQGGKIEVVEWVKPVEFDFLDMAINEDGTYQMADKKERALFIHLRGTWQDETEDEFYPLFDNQSAKIIRTPDALDLNTAKQRGMVRLIARLSGIGLWIFEQQETQFDEDGTPEKLGEKTTIKVLEKKEIEKEESKEETPKRKISKKTNDVENQKKALEEVVVAETQENKEETVVSFVESKYEETPIEEQTSTGFFKGFLAGETLKKQEESLPSKNISKTQQTQKEDKFDKDSEEYASIMMEVRAQVKAKNAQKEAKTFVVSKGKELLSELTYQELLELKNEF